MCEVVKVQCGIGQRKRCLGGVRILVAMVPLLGIGAVAGAFEIPTGSEDVQLRWDNTFRYTLADRVEGREKAIINNPNFDDGDRNFAPGIVSNRLDLLSEMDFVYKKNYGARVSGAGWYDQRYNDGVDNTSTATSNHIVNGSPARGLNNYTKRYFAGPNGELLDAFGFGNFNIMGTPVNIKIGRHTEFWGESLLLGGTIHGISYAQSPLDLAKGLAMPGAEAKELFRPLNNISFQIQPTTTLSIAGQYFLEWESNKFVESGSYLGMYDMFMNGSEALISGPGQRLLRGVDVTPSGVGDWGLSARWSPDWLDGTLGFYYRNFSDKMPQLHVRPAVASLPVSVGTALGFTQLGAANGAGKAPFYVNPSAASLANIGKGNVGQFHMAYAENIDLFGLSFSKQVLGVSVGSEVSYRHNMPLVSDFVNILPAPLAAGTPGAISAIPGEGETGGARGDTWHALVNVLGTINKTPLFDSASWNMEYVWNHVDHVTRGAAVYKGRASYVGIDKPTDHFVGGALGFTPTWFQVFSGVDLSMPLSISSGLIGNSAVTLGGNKNSGSYAVGLSADILMKYKAELKYVDFFGDYDTNPATGAVTVANGANGLLSDRGMVVLTLKATF